MTRFIEARMHPLLLIPAGLVAFMAYLYWATGNLLAFRDVQAAWMRSSQVGFFGTPILDYGFRPTIVSDSWSFRLLNFCVTVLAMAAGLTLVVRRAWAFMIYTLAGVVVPLSSLSLQAMVRYVLVLFPVFIVLGGVGRHALAAQVIRIVFVLLLGVLTVLYVGHVTLAMA